MMHLIAASVRPFIVVTALFLTMGSAQAASVVEQLGADGANGGLGVAGGDGAGIDGVSYSHNTDTTVTDYGLRYVGGNGGMGGAGSTGSTGADGIAAVNPEEHATNAGDGTAGGLAADGGLGGDLTNNTITNAASISTGLDGISLEGGAGGTGGTGGAGGAGGSGVGANGGDAEAVPSPGQADWFYWYNAANESGVYASQGDDTQHRQPGRGALGGNGGVGGQGGQGQVGGDLTFNTVSNTGAITTNASGMTLTGGQGGQGGIGGVGGAGNGGGSSGAYSTAIGGTGGNLGVMRPGDPRVEDLDSRYEDSNFRLWDLMGLGGRVTGSKHALGGADGGEGGNGGQGGAGAQGGSLTDNRVINRGDIVAQGAGMQIMAGQGGTGGTGGAGGKAGNGGDGLDVAHGGGVAGAGGSGLSKTAACVTSDHDDDICGADGGDGGSADNTLVELDGYNGAAGHGGMGGTGGIGGHGGDITSNAVINGGTIQSGLDGILLQAGAGGNGGNGGAGGNGGDGGRGLKGTEGVHGGPGGGGGEGEDGNDHVLYPTPGNAGGDGGDGGNASAGADGREGGRGGDGGLGGLAGDAGNGGHVASNTVTNSGTITAAGSAIVLRGGDGGNGGIGGTSGRGGNGGNGGDGGNGGNGGWGGSGGSGGTGGNCLGDPVNPLCSNQPNASDGLMGNGGNAGRGGHGGDAGRNGDNAGGGDGGNGGDGGSVYGNSVTNSGALTAGSHGISLAGGDAGNGGAAGGDNTINTYAAYAGNGGDGGNGGVGHFASGDAGNGGNGGDAAIASRTGSGGAAGTYAIPGSAGSAGSVGSDFYGTILASGVAGASGTYGGDVYDNTITNSGSITAQGNGIQFLGGTGLVDGLVYNNSVSNSAAGQVSGVIGILFGAGDNNSVNNAGLITSPFANGTGIQFNGGNNASVINTGTISATSSTGTNNGILMTNVTGGSVTNSGSIKVTGDNAYGLHFVGGGNQTINSTGSIVVNGTTDARGIYIENGSGTNVINVGGLISATGGGTPYAIFADTGDYTLNLNTGWMLIGQLDLGNGNNTINIYAPPGSSSGGGGSTAGISSTLTFANLGTTQVNLEGIDGLKIGDMIVIVDPSGQSAQASALGVTTFMLHELIHQQLTGSHFSESTSFATLGMSSGDFIDQGDPNAWFKVFGGHRSRETDGLMLEHEQDYEGFAAGYEVNAWNGRLGGFAGYANGRVRTTLTSIDTNTETGFAGLYYKRDLGWVDIAANLMVGYESHDNERLVFDNLVGYETAEADFDSVFISPSVTLSKGYQVHPQWELRPSATLAYAIGKYDDYTEAGTTNSNLNVDDRTVRSLTAQVQLAAKYAMSMEKGEFEARIGARSRRQNDDGTTLSLAGATFDIDAGAKDRASGVYVGGNLRYQINDNLSLSGDLEYSELSGSEYGTRGFIGIEYNWD